MVKWAALLEDGCEYLQLEGNHEDRLRRYVWGNAREIAQMVYIVPEMLGFKELNKLRAVSFKWHPIGNYKSCRIGDTILHHGHFFNEHVAVNNLKRYPEKLITGHTHRLQLAYYGDKWSCTLGHGSLEASTAHIPAPSGWCQAFGVLTEVRGECSLEVIPVNNGRCVLRGEQL